MTWVFSGTSMSGSTLTATVKNPEFADRWARNARQRAIETDGGVLFVQDLMVNDRFLDVRWASLTEGEWSELDLLFREVSWRAGPLSLTIDGDAPFPVELSTGQEINGQPINTGDLTCDGRPLNTGMIVMADKAQIDGLVLDTSETSFTHQRGRRGSLALALRLPTSSAPIVGGA